MPTVTRDRFTHRHNKDGTHDSICFACLATIVSVRDENDLLRYEATHICDPVRLHQLGMDTLLFDAIDLTHPSRKLLFRSQETKAGYCSRSHRRQPC